MRFNRQTKKKQKDNIFPLSIQELEQLLKHRFKSNPHDLMFSQYEKNGKKLVVFCLSYQIDTNKLEESLLSPLLKMKEKWSNNTIPNAIPLGSSSTESNMDRIFEKLVIGEVFIYVEHENEAITYILLNKEKRQLEKAETESLVLGPKIAFTESLITNMNIVHWRIRSDDLVMEEVMVGKTVPREVRIVYMKTIANEADVNTMRQRILDLDVDNIEDSVVLKQYLEDNQSSILPQFDSSELPDRFTYAITAGKIGLLVENSPTAIIAPASFFSFFESTEDFYMRWQAGTFLLALRFIAMFFTITVTPLYVAIVSYQYGIIPTKLMITLGQSRAAVPFPPLLEALLLEFLIELLQEAGARLPTKVGQTMGIVGGIVIGEAAVQAGLTSNILIIAVAMSALASFTAPNYMLGTSVRLLRFPLILVAGLYGLFGLMFGLCFFLIHLIRMKSLGRPYLTPLYPLRLKDFNKVFFRSPMSFNNKRATTYRPKFLFRYSKKEAKQKRDLDEGE